MPETRRRGPHTHEQHRYGLRVGGSTAVVSGREIPRFFSPHRALHGFVFYAADRELSEEPPKELTVEFPKELRKELPEALPEALPEMRQVGLKLTKLAANVAKIAILAASLVNIAILAANMANASMANEEKPSNFQVSTRTLRKSSWWKTQAWFYHSQIKARASKGRSMSASASVTVLG